MGVGANLTALNFYEYHLSILSWNYPAVPILFALFWMAYSFAVSQFTVSLQNIDTWTKNATINNHFDPKTKTRDDDIWPIAFSTGLMLFLGGYFGLVDVHGFELHEVIERPDSGFFSIIFYMLFSLALMLIHIALYLFGIAASLGLFVFIPILAFIFIMSLPFFCYGCVAAVHSFFTHHPGEELLKQENPDIEEYIKATKQLTKGKKRAFVSENYRKKSAKLLRELESSDLAKKAKQQRINEQRQRIQLEKQRRILERKKRELEEEERRLTEQYGSKSQRERQQALNEQDAEFSRRMAKIMKGEDDE